jgi:hypothetical protein
MKLNLLKFVIFGTSAAIRVNSFQIGTISAGLFANARLKLGSDGTNATHQIIKKRRARSSGRVSATIGETVLDDDTLDRGATPREEAYASAPKRRFVPAMVKNVPSSALAGCGLGFFVGRSALVHNCPPSPSLASIKT